MHKVALTESSGQALDHPGLNSIYQYFCAENTYMGGRSGWGYTSALGELVAN